MDASLVALEAKISRSEVVRELAEGKADPNKTMEETEWASRVDAADAEIGRWKAFVASIICALLHLPALALESCWPSFLGIGGGSRVMVLSHWVAFGATFLLLGVTLMSLVVGADKRRGKTPFLVGFFGSWLVILNPIYFLLADHLYIQAPAAQDMIVLLLTIVGVVVLVIAASWNASVDRVIAAWCFPLWRKGARSSLSQESGVHVLVSGPSDGDESEDGDVDLRRY